MNADDAVYVARVAILLATLAPALAFGARSMLRNGGRTWPAPDWVVARHGARVVLGLVELGLCAAWWLALHVFHADVPIAPAIARWPLLAAGAALMTFGAWLVPAARERLGRFFTPTLGVQRDHELVTDGPYAITRHPIYTGILAYLAGSALAWNSGVTLLLAAAVAVPFAMQAAIEERLFAEHFGASFDEWRSRVPRLLPWPRPRG